NGTLYTAHAVKEASQNKTQVQWFEIATNQWPTSGTPSLIAQDTVNSLHPPTTNTSTFFPALARNAGGFLGLAVSTGDTFVPPGIAIAGRNSSTQWTASFMNIKTGQCSSGKAWGDYCGIAVDPDDTTFWVMAEYMLAGGTNWATWIQ